MAQDVAKRLPHALSKIAATVCLLLPSGISAAECPPGPESAPGAACQLILEPKIPGIFDPSGSGIYPFGGDALPDYGLPKWILPNPGLPRFAPPRIEYPYEAPTIDQGPRDVPGRNFS
jgi:hypothetical protein